MRKRNVRCAFVSSLLVISIFLSGCGGSDKTPEINSSTVNTTTDSAMDTSKTEEETTENKTNETIEQSGEQSTDEATLDTTDSSATEETTSKEVTDDTTETSKETEKKTENKTQSTTSKKETHSLVETTTSEETTKQEETTLNSEEEYNKDMKEKRALAVEKIKKIMPTIVNSSMTELQKIIAIHDWIVVNVDYALDQYQTGNISKYSHTAWGGLETGYVVCNGYAELFRLMAAEVGIEAKDISGYGNIGLGDQAHRWSQVKIDGKWYNVDMTWDDPVWNNKEFDDNGSITYTYFLLSDAEFYKDHKVHENPAYNATQPSVCNSSIGIPAIIDASVTKRAVYFYDENDYDRLEKDIAAIVKTKIDSFAVYCMNGNYLDHKRSVNSMVAKTLGKYEEGNVDLPSEGPHTLYYEWNEEMYVASGEAECIEMLKKAIEARENDIELRMRCVDTAFADDKENYDGDMYYNKENDRREAVMYKWAGKAGIHLLLGCISGDGYADVILWDESNYGKVIVSDSEQNALIRIKEYLDSLQDVSNAKIYLVFDAQGVEERQVGNYLYENDYTTEYNIDWYTPSKISDSVYYMSDITVAEANKVYDKDSLKTYIEKCEAEGKYFYVYYYDSNITKDNYLEYMYGLYENIGGAALYNTKYVRDGVVYILY